MRGHIHAGLVFITSVLAAMIIIHVATRAVLVHQGDKAWAQGLNWAM